MFEAASVFRQFFVERRNFRRAAGFDDDKKENSDEIQTSQSELDHVEAWSSSRHDFLRT